MSRTQTVDWTRRPTKPPTKPWLEPTLASKPNWWTHIAKLSHSLLQSQSLGTLGWRCHRRHSATQIVGCLRSQVLRGGVHVRRALRQDARRLRLWVRDHPSQNPNQVRHPNPPSMSSNHATQHKLRCSLSTESYDSQKKVLNRIVEVSRLRIMIQ
jgi:hypothetical protein